MISSVKNNIQRNVNLRLQITSGIEGLNFIVIDCEKMALCSSDVTRLIHHHLLKEGYEKSADALVGECPQLKDFKPANQPY